MLCVVCVSVCVCVPVCLSMFVRNFFFAPHTEFCLLQNSRKRFCVCTVDGQLFLLLQEVKRDAHLFESDVFNISPMVSLHDNRLIVNSIAGVK